MRRGAALFRSRAGLLAIFAGMALVVIVVLMLLSGNDERGIDTSSPPVQGAGEQGATASAAKRADDFVESVGVNVHFGYTDTAYRRHDLVKSKLHELGVRYVRDGLSRGQPDVYRAWRALASRGIKVDLIVGDPLQRWGIGPLEEQLAVVKRELRGAVASLEGPNEYDIQGEPNWVSPLRSYQQRLFEQVTSDPALDGISVVGPTVVKPENRKKLGDISRWLDYGNMHPYPGGLAPDRDSQLEQELDWATLNAGSKRLQATETGYHNGVNSAASHPAATERAAGTYIPRLYLDYFRRGIARTFVYELVDQQPDETRENNEANFGLLRNDFSEKPAFVVLKRLVSLLRDPGPDFKAARLDYSIEGAPPSLRRLLLQKRDGSFYLVLWTDESVWDPATKKSNRPAAHRVRLKFPNLVKRVEVYRPNRSERSVEHGSEVRSLPLSPSAEVSVVKIVPSGNERLAPVSTRDSAPSSP